MPIVDKTIDSLAEVADFNYRKEKQRIADSLHTMWSKPYVLITKYKNETQYNYGTFKELEVIKCGIYQEMVERAKSVDSLEAKAILDGKQTAKELEILNKPCNTQQ